MCDSLIITDYDNIPEDTCYKLKVWNMQKKYTTLVSSYLSGLQFGSVCKSQKENLKMFKRCLDVLNRYDTRDILTDTLNYNNIPYSNMKSILNMLSNKY